MTKSKAASATGFDLRHAQAYAGEPVKHIRPRSKYGGRLLLRGRLWLRGRALATRLTFAPRSDLGSKAGVGSAADFPSAANSLSAASVGSAAGFCLRCRLWLRGWRCLRGGVLLHGRVWLRPRATSAPQLFPPRILSCSEPPETRPGHKRSPRRGAPDWRHGKVGAGAAAALRWGYILARPFCDPNRGFKNDPENDPAKISSRRIGRGHRSRRGALRADIDLVVAH